MTQHMLRDKFMSISSRIAHGWMQQLTLHYNISSGDIGSGNILVPPGYKSLPEQN